MKKKSEQTTIDQLSRVLAAQYKSLVEAQSPEPLLADYARLLRYIRSPRSDFNRRARLSKGLTHEQLETLPELNFMEMSLSDLEILISNEETPRRLLETIAINRFSVPRGSMRAFSSRTLLADKLISLIRNEKIHQMIGTIARTKNQ